MTDEKHRLTVLEKRAAAQQWREEKAVQYRRALRSSVMGLEIMIFILMGGGIGYYIDKTYDTAPWGFWIGGFFGVSGAIKTMVVMVREYHKAHGDTDAPPNSTESSDETDF